MCKMLLFLLKMYLRLSAGSLLVVESSYSSLEFQTVIVYAIVNSLLFMRSTPQATLTAINCRRQTKVNLRLPEGVATPPRLFAKICKTCPRSPQFQFANGHLF
jgi:hypothetical protein